MDNSFEATLVSGNKQELNELKRWLFEENIRLAIKQKELNELHEKFLKERQEFQTEMEEINLRNVTERKRLKDEETFFDKRMEILKNGFSSLESDRKEFEREKRIFEADKKRYEASRPVFSNAEITGLLFAGVNNALSLKKRYRDLLKIFHPDNLCGDNTMVTIINREYDRLKQEFEYSQRSSNR